MSVTCRYRSPNKRREINRANPAIPFFGVIDYPVTPGILRLAVIGRPDLEEVARTYLVGTEDVTRPRLRFPRRVRFEDTDGNDRDEARSIGPKPRKFTVQQDLEKWQVFRNSGRAMTLALLGGKWVGLRKGGIFGKDSLLKPFKIRKGYRQNDVLLGGRAITVAEKFPEGWENQNWLKLVMVGDCYELLGGVEIAGIWDPEAGQWASAEIGDLDMVGLARHYSDLVSDAVESERFETVNSISFDHNLAVHVVYLSETHIVTADDRFPEVSFTVGLEDYAAKLKGYTAAMDEAYRPHFEAGIKAFANDQIVTDAWPSLRCAVDTLLANDPNVFQAKRYGPEHQGSEHQLKKLVSALKTTHGAKPEPEPERGRGFDFSSFDEKPRMDRFGRANARPMQPAAPKIDIAAIEQLRARYRSEGQAAVKGAFWRQWEPVFIYKDDEPLETSSTVVRTISTLPTDALLERIAKERPDALELVRGWRALFDRSFPGWQEQCVTREQPGAPRKDRDLERLKSIFGRGPGRVYPSDFAEIDSLLRGEPGEQPARDCRNAIRDADVAMAIAYGCEPRSGILMSPIGTHIVNGPGPDGEPMLDDAFETTSRNRFNDRLLHRKFDFWNWPFLMGHLGKKLAKTSHFEIGFTLFDMKLHGHTEAVLTNFNSWYEIDLTKGTSVSELALLANAEMGDDWKKGELFVTEKIGFEMDQRFFVIDGRVAASTAIGNDPDAPCSRRRRLDERVRTRAADGTLITRPERNAAAALTRKARAVAADLKANGILECAIEIAMTGRGPQLTWVTPLDTAGLGTLPVERYVEAFKRKRVSLGRTLERSLTAEISRIVEEPWIRTKALEVLVRNRERLPVIMERQYDLGSKKFASSDVYPNKLVEAAATSFVLTGLLEMEATESVYKEAAE